MLPSTTHLFRVLRKHRLLILGAFVVVTLLLLPLSAGKRISAADIFQLYAPWHQGTVTPANGLMNDAATSFFSAVPMMRRSAGSFVWNPYRGGGTAGWHSAGLGMLSPFSLLPAFMLPLSFFFAGVMLLKLTAGLLLAYGWLREERLGKRGAALGALVASAAGVTTMWWLWPTTSATVVCPAVLWIVARTRRGRATPVAAVAATALVILLSGFPSTILYVFYLGFAYAVHAAFVARVKAVRPAFAVVTGAAIAAAIALPALIPFAQTIRKSGYLELRAKAAAVSYPPSHLLALVKPYRLITPGGGWKGDGRLGRNDNLPESTIYAGKLPLLLAGLAIFLGRGRRWFWTVAAAVILAAMFGIPVISDALAGLPGMRFTPLTRLRLLLPFPIAFLTASAICGFERMAGLRRRRIMQAGVLAAIILTSTDLALFLRSFTPYIDPSLATPGSTAGLRWLQAQPKPFRIAALDTTLWPDVAEYVGLEDVRSHYPVERDYRRLLAEIDPNAFGSHGTVILFDARTTRLESPVLRRLNVRFLATAPESAAVDRAIQRGAAPSWTLAYRGPDLKVYRNERVQERFFADGPAKVTTVSSSETRFVIDTVSSQPFLLDSSEKLTDELRVRVDGRRVKPTLRAGLFAAVRVPAGRHRVVFERSLPPWRLAIAGAGVIALLASCVLFLTQRTNERRLSLAR